MDKIDLVQSLPGSITAQQPTPLLFPALLSKHPPVSNGGGSIIEPDTPVVHWQTYAQIKIIRI